MPNFQECGGTYTPASERAESQGGDTVPYECSRCGCVVPGKPATPTCTRVICLVCHKPPGQCTCPPQESEHRSPPAERRHHGRFRGPTGSGHLGKS